jgi:hypothetical protein
LTALPASRAARSATGPASQTATTAAVYDVLGVRVGVASSDPAALALIDRSYAGFRAADLDAPRWLSLETLADGAARVTGADGNAAHARSGGPAALELLHQLVVEVMAGLLDRGLYAVHAGSVSRNGAALVLAGPGGVGKTTLTLALAARGFEVLSDELAIIDPGARAVLPYRRNVHVRPGTPALVDGLGWLTERPVERLGGGIAWAIPQAELAPRLDDTPRRLAGIVLLAPRNPAVAVATLDPVRGSIAVLELLRSTWAASRDFVASIAALGAAVEGVACVRLTPADPMPSADLLASWFEAVDG